ncbi:MULTISPECIES: polyamine ABC transporter substrate-binding protein [unclassified Pseudomonas]|jgi:putrescine transport system substrate-binding protein|uniref:polyamine ABC transporter substrate-binding protein n=1 Tax=unclassified Pseudomonas TaxID=196821 RepID=UPI000EAA8393|nr:MULTISPECIES: polyamine ABC transporter substrate-binding protein [unclassified Pseudomonas]AYF85851.1 polyamine ABC transporter substrate-binding protein [Pseudomonas sp. DY-1]MDH4656379.1 polyamine ABC transporter substrate-binding protein [Pseudomonas sp. BN606]MRK19530.1 polyamine ABC transporter substrate-binding protein [Pseudomonas sp. JG-B]
MRKTLVAALGATLILLPALSPADDGNTLRLYNWSDYMGEHTLAEFEKATGIKVIYDTFDSYETVQGKLLPGRSGYDLVVLNAALVPPLLKAGVFQPLDKGRLPSWSNLDPQVLANLEHFDPGVAYSAPYTWGSNGITYNVDMIKARMPDAPIGSLAMVFDPEIVSRFADCGVTLIDSPTDVLPLALAYLGRDPNSAEPEDLKAAQDLLMKVRPYIRKFDSMSYLNGLANGDQCIAMTWSGDYATAQARATEAGAKVKLDYFIPKEGSLIWFDDFYIPKDAPHVENAHKFIEYMLQPKVIAQVTDYIRYANSNKAATPLVAAEVRNDPAIYPDDATRARLFTQKTQPQKAMRLITRTWNAVKTGK